MKKLVKIALIASLTSVLGFAYADVTGHPVSGTIINASTDLKATTNVSGDSISPGGTLAYKTDSDSNITVTATNHWGNQVKCQYYFKNDEDGNTVAIGYPTANCPAQTVTSANYGQNVVLMPNVDAST